MTLTARGNITIDTTQLTTDPEVYEAYRWPKRASVLKGLEGSVTIQDFGVYAADLELHLSSGANQYMEQEAVEAIDALYRVQGATYTLTDWLGNEFTVFILSFQPKPTFIGTLWTYEMTLQVTAITTLLGTSYSGG